MKAARTDARPRWRLVASRNNRRAVLHLARGIVVYWRDGQPSSIYIGLECGGSLCGPADWWPALEDVPELPPCRACWEKLGIEWTERAMLTA